MRVKRGLFYVPGVPRVFYPPVEGDSGIDVASYDSSYLVCLGLDISAVVATYCRKFLTYLIDSFDGPCSPVGNLGSCAAHRSLSEPNVIVLWCYELSQLLAAAGKVYIPRLEVLEAY